ncbi:MAG TPA: endo-1,3-alpha-glucanase family glycosylhydrolase [Capsulimonadaceae bacterium]|jgi:hypothetical protein
MHARISPIAFGAACFLCFVALISAHFAWAVAPIYSVEQLPIDKFDQFQTGSLPPAPWTRLKVVEPGVDLALRPEAESPFVGNKVTGKGLVMTVSKPGGGANDGIERRFTPAPPGGQFLAFDFQLSSNGATGNKLDLACDFVDGKGKGVALIIEATGGLGVAAADGLRLVANIDVDVWYHVTAQTMDDGTLTVSATKFGAKSPVATVSGLRLPPSQPFNTLRFHNTSGMDQQGSWMVDNVFTAGQVDAPRSAWWPFDQLPITQLRASDKKVFVYYFPIYTAGPTSEDPSLSWYSRTIMNPSKSKNPETTGTEFEYCPLQYPPLPKLASDHEEWVRAREHEVILARQMGCDGFFADLQAFPHPAGGSYFNEQTIALMEAAVKVDPGFKIIPAIYGPDEKNATDETAVAFANASIVKRALGQASLYKLEDGRVVLSCWYPERYPATWWTKVFAEFEKNGTKVAFIPQFNSVSHLSEFSPISYGMANWGPRTPGRYDWVKTVKGLTTKAVFPIVEQDVRTWGGYWESGASELLRELWTTAIEDNADWAFINTWSDYTEQAQAPSRAIGFAPFDIDAYYTQWFKTGRQPQIKRDVLYYFYRIHHSSAVPAHGKKWSLMQAWGKSGAVVKDEIELVAFLKSPGQLRIQIGDKVYTNNAPAGITSFKAPFLAGESFTPVFTLSRGQKIVVSQPGQYSVLDKIEFGNMLYHSGVISPDAAK